MHLHYVNTTAKLIENIEIINSTKKTINNLESKIDYLTSQLDYKSNQKLSLTKIKTEKKENDLYNKFYSLKSKIQLLKIPFT